MNMDEDMVAAFVDGELDELAARRIAREAESDAALAASIARHRALKSQLAAHYAPVAEEPVPERLRAMLATDRGVDTSLAERRESRRRARFAPVHWGAIAASLALGLTVGLKPWTPAADVASIDGRIVAAGALEGALDRQLASNQPAGAAVRIGLSFRDGDGRYCRSFEGADLAGIGCREGGGWTLETTLSGVARADYRQASAGELMEDAAAMMEGAPLDAAAERAARDAGWRD